MKGEVCLPEVPELSSTPLTQQDAFSTLFAHASANRCPPVRCPQATDRELDAQARKGKRIGPVGNLDVPAWWHILSINGDPLSASRIPSFSDYDRSTRRVLTWRSCPLITNTHHKYRRRSDRPLLAASSATVRLRQQCCLISFHMHAIYLATSGMARISWSADLPQQALAQIDALGRPAGSNNTIFAESHRSWVA